MIPGHVVFSQPNFFFCSLFIGKHLEDCMLLAESGTSEHKDSPIIQYFPKTN